MTHMNPMQDQAYRLALLTDFNAQNLSVLLQKSSKAPGITCREAPYGQIMPLLLDPQSEFWREPYDALLVWALPERALRTFTLLLACEPFSTEQLLEEVDTFCAAIRTACPRANTVLVPTFVAPGVGRGLGMLEFQADAGIARTLLHLNLRMVERLGPDPRVIVLDAQRWLQAAGATAYRPKLWYLAKTPFDTRVFQAAVQDIVAAFDALRGRSKKVLILDLDDTLWGGIVGDDGWQNLRIGGHDPVGEAYVDFQEGLRSLKNRGVSLALVSKNEEDVALDAIRNHPEMVLTLDDFAAWRINWRDKAENIADLMSDLNLGIDSAVFLDDSAFERARVREALPQVFVPDLPADPMDYPVFLAQLTCFDRASISAEDRTRTAMYRADRARTALREKAPSLDQWLHALEVQVVAASLDESNLARSAQLFNKTNQMNLSTRRMTAPELLAWSRGERHHLWVFRVSDRFGDYGLCGLCSLIHEGTRVRLLDFVLSCRVMCRGVEEVMLSVAAQHARQLRCEELYAEYQPTPRNRPCERWFESHPQVRRNNNTFLVSLSDAIEAPPHVRTS